MGRSWQFWGRGIRFGLYYVGYPRLNWYAVLPAAEEQRPPDSSKRVLLERFAEWPAPVEAVLEAAAEDTFQRTPIYDIDPMEHWGSGCMTLLGDAAHGATPGAGRGASEALEDAVVLAGCLTSMNSVADALAAYEERRRQPTATVIKRSRSIGAMGCWSSPLACAARDLYFRAIYGRMVRKTMQAELTA